VLQKSSGAKINKIDDNDFKTHMASDIIFLSETHTSYTDTLTCEGYKCFLNCRSNCPSKKRGVFAVFIKRNILPGISLVDKTLSELMWFKLNANFFGFVRDLFVCFMYIAPVNSSYVKSTGLDKQVFAKLEEDIVRYNLKGDIMLMGDLNTHINSDDCDFIYNDDDKIFECFFTKTIYF
jgi:hypothetical protein